MTGFFFSKWRIIKKSGATSAFSSYASSVPRYSNWEKPNVRKDKAVPNLVNWVVWPYLQLPQLTLLVPQLFFCEWTSPFMFYDRTHTALNTDDQTNPYRSRSHKVAPMFSLGSWDHITSLSSHKKDIFHSPKVPAPTHLSSSCGCINFHYRKDTRISHVQKTRVLVWIPCKFPYETHGIACKNPWDDMCNEWWYVSSLCDDMFLHMSPNVAHATPWVFTC